MNASLVGVFHSTPDLCLGANLLNAECRSEFVRVISPMLDKNSLLVIEGGWSSVFTQSSWQYFLRHYAATLDLGEFEHGPALVWRDPRTRFGARDMTGIHVPALCVSLFSSLVWDEAALDAITSLDEVGELARDGALPVWVDRELTDQECFYVKALTRSFKKFDAAMLAVANEWKKGQVFIITGAMHTMTLHLRSGLPSVCLAGIQEKKMIIALAALTGITLPKRLGIW